MPTSAAAIAPITPSSASGSTRTAASQLRPEAVTPGPMSTQTLIDRYRLALLRTADASPQRGGSGGEAINELLATFMLARRALHARHKSHHDPTSTEKAASTMRVRPPVHVPSRLNSDGT